MHPFLLLHPESLTRYTPFFITDYSPVMDPAGPPGVPTPKAANDGDSDAAPDKEPSQFLLVRGLEASVTEELLAKGVSKLYRPSGAPENAPGNQKKGSKVASTTGDSNLGAPEGSLRRVLLVRDRRTNESWRYGFAEFAGVAVCSFPTFTYLFSSNALISRMPKLQWHDSNLLRNLPSLQSRYW